MVLNRNIVLQRNTKEDLLGEKCGFFVDTMNVQHFVKSFLFAVIVRTFLLALKAMTHQTTTNKGFSRVKNGLRW